MRCRPLLTVAAMLSSAVLGVLVLAHSGAHAASATTPAISDDASTALLNMGKTLLSKEFSFQVDTIRIYQSDNDKALHIFHTITVTVRRPDHLRAVVVGDDGTFQLLYDGKTLSLVNVDANKYTTLPVPDTIQKMMEVAMGKLGVDFPLADFLTEAPNKAFLSGVTKGEQVGMVKIDGVPCRHLFFSQPPGIGLEFWVEANEQALPRRLIVTYDNLPWQPSFIAMFSKWDFSVHPTDADFEFTPPAGATKVDLKAAAQ